MRFNEITQYHSFLNETLNRLFVQTKRKSLNEHKTFQTFFFQRFKFESGAVKCYLMTQL